MAWIEIHQSLPSHRKTIAAATRLAIPPVQLVGHMVTLWLWAVDNAPGGDLSTIGAAVVAYASLYTGDAQQFMDTLTEVGFVDSNGMVHNWDLYMGRLQSKREHHREYNRQRARNLRATTPQLVQPRARARQYQTVPDQVPISSAEEIGADAPADPPEKEASTEAPAPKSAHELRDDAIAALRVAATQRDKVGVILDLWPLVFGSRYPPPDGGMVARMGTLAGGFGPVVNAMVSAAANEITDDPRSYVLGVLNGRKRRAEPGSGNSAPAIRRPGDTGHTADLDAALTQQRYPPGWTFRDGKYVREVQPALPHP